MVDADDGRFSVATPRRFWYPACRSGDIDKRPVAITFDDVPLVVFRDATGGAGALLDRCPHRNVPLSAGRAHPAGGLECGYHGWRFDPGGRCVAIPGLVDVDADAPSRCVPSHATREQDGFVWIWGQPDAVPEGDPFPIPEVSGRRPGQTVFTYDLDCTLHAALENALDVPHTAFLHRGIFRGAGETKAITAVRRPVPGGLEVEYLGEPVALGRIRPRGGTTFDHWDRFFMPCVAQVEYGVGGWLRIVNTILHLPLSPFRTRAWFVVRYSSPVPPAVVAPIVRGRGRQILRQDARMLAQQTAVTRRFGGERFASTDLDLIGAGIWRLLRAAERAEQQGADGDDQRAPVELSERTVTFRA